MVVSFCISKTNCNAEDVPASRSAQTRHSSTARESLPSSVNGTPGTQSMQPLAQHWPSVTILDRLLQHTPQSQLVELSAPATTIHGRTTPDLCPSTWLLALMMIARLSLVQISMLSNGSPSTRKDWLMDRGPLSFTWWPTPTASPTSSQRLWLPEATWSDMRQLYVFSPFETLSRLTLYEPIKRTPTDLMCF